MHVIHVGAGYDQCFWIMAKLLPGVHFHLFECDPRTIGKLTASHGELSNTCIYSEAFHVTEGTVTFYQCVTPQGSSLFQYERDQGQRTEISVPSINGLRFMRELEGPIALSMNAEGAEFIVIPELLKDMELVRRIMFCRIAWHGDAGRLPQYANDVKRLQKEMKRKGIAVLTETMFYLQILKWATLCD